MSSFLSGIQFLLTSPGEVAASCATADANDVTSSTVRGFIFQFPAMKGFLAIIIGPNAWRSERHRDEENTFSPSVFVFARGSADGPNACDLATTSKSRQAALNMFVSTQRFYVCLESESESESNGSESMNLSLSLKWPLLARIDSGIKHSWRRPKVVF